MVILLFCVFGITPDSNGIVKETRLELDETRYFLVRDEIGNSEKKKLCRHAFHQSADLAWFEDVKPTSF